jgi:predicted acyl esterase
VGHPRAQNKPAQWERLNDQAWQFLQSQINGSHRQQTTVSSMPTICPLAGQPENDLDAIERLTGRTPEDLSNGTLAVAYQGSGVLANRSVDSKTLVDPADPDSLQTDPVLGFVASAPGCRHGTPAGALLAPPIRYTGRSEPLDQPRTYIGLGYVNVPYVLTSAGYPTATVNVRVWDMTAAADGAQSDAVLVTRGTYRIDAPAYDSVTGTLTVPLFGNQWTFRPGHIIRLDLTLVDSPTFLASNQPETLTFSTPTLVLPTREATQLTIAGT